MTWSFHITARSDNPRNMAVVFQPAQENIAIGENIDLLLLIPALLARGLVLLSVVQDPLPTLRHNTDIAATMIEKMQLHEQATLNN